MCFRQRMLVVLLSCSLLAGCGGGLSGKKFSTKAFTRVLQPGRRVSEEDRARSDFAAANSRVAEERGELQNAEDMYQEAIRINPENADALWRLALLHVRQEKFGEATKAFERASALDGKNPALCADFGYHLYLAGDLQRAEECLRQTRRLSPSDKRACNNLGLVLAAQGRDEESLAAFLDAGCTEAEARGNLAIAQLMRLDTSAAADSLQASLAIDPQNPQALSARQQLAAWEQSERLTAAADSGYSTNR